MNIKKLKQLYSVDGQIDITEGDNGIPFIELNNDTASAVISLYGGQILSYKPSGNAETLFLSKLANYQEGKAIKGGIPVCWPWFGADPEGKDRQAHGFARNKMWQLRSTEKIDNDQSKVVMGLNEDAQTRKMWPYNFDLSIEFDVGETLDVSLITRNTGDQAFKITQALHSYFSVGNIEQVFIKGLDKKAYLDKANINKGKEDKVQSGNVEFTQEVDRIYLDVPESIQISDSASKQLINIASAGNRTAVVWNPGADISQQMSDLENTDFQRFVCVETVNAASDVIEILPGESFVLSASFKVSGLE